MSEKEEMAEDNIIQELRKKSAEIVESNQELTGLISRLTSELTRSENELEEKKKFMTSYEENLKRVQMELAEKEDLIKTLGERLEEQAKENDAKSVETAEVETLVEKKQKEIAELQRHIKIRQDENNLLKQKLADKILQVQNLDKHAQELEKQVEDTRKDSFILKNKVAGLESGIYATNDKNQKIMYELIKARERVKQLEEDLDTETTLWGKKTEEYERDMERIRKEEEEKKIRIMKLHTRKIATLNAQLASLRAHVEKQTKAMTTKTEKETDLIRDFTDRLKDLAQTSAEIPKISTLFADAPKIELEIGGEEEEELELNNPDFYDKVTSKPVEFESYEGSRVNEIMPMIEIAIQHGDSEEGIRKTLANSGYKQADIEQAFIQFS